MNDQTSGPTPNQSVAPVPAAGIQFSQEVLAKSLLTIATSAWKLRTRTLDGQTKEPREQIGKDDVKKMVRQVDAIFEALLNVGIEIRDRTGEPFHYGLPERIVSSAPQAGLTKELIIETIRPTIYWMNYLAQNGEVVIATPVEPKA